MGTTDQTAVLPVTNGSDTGNKIAISKTSNRSFSWKIANAFRYLLPYPRKNPELYWIALFFKLQKRFGSSFLSGKTGVELPAM